MDIDLVNRLQQLKQSERDKLPTEDEVSARLAALKGLPSDYYKKKQTVAYQPPVRQSQTQQVDSLLNQVWI